MAFDPFLRWTVMPLPGLVDGFAEWDDAFVDDLAGKKGTSSVPRGHYATTVPCSDTAIHGPVANRLRGWFYFRPQADDGHFGKHTDSSATATTFATAIIPGRCGRRYIHRPNGRPTSIVIHDAQRVQTADSN